MRYTQMLVGLWALLVAFPVCASSSKLPLQPPSKIITGSAQLLGIQLGAQLNSPPCGTRQDTIGGGIKLPMPDTNGNPNCGVAQSADRDDPAYSEYEMHFDHLADPYMHLWTVIVTAYSNEVAEILITTRGIKDDALAMSQLREKFGEPTEITTHRDSNMVGATFDVTDAAWKFSDGSIVTYHSALNRFDQGSIDGKSNAQLEREETRQRAYSHGATHL